MPDVIIFFTGNFGPQSSILSRLIPGNGLSVRRFQMERGDHITLRNFSFDYKIAKSFPSPGFIFGLPIQFLFHVDENIGKNSISLLPGLNDFIIHLVPQNIFYSLDQVFSYDGVLFRYDSDRPMLMGNSCGMG